MNADNKFKNSFRNQERFEAKFCLTICFSDEIFADACLPIVNDLETQKAYELVITAEAEKVWRGFSGLPSDFPSSSRAASATRTIKRWHAPRTGLLKDSVD